jgi:phosphoribosylformylglycinamidine synthase
VTDPKAMVLTGEGINCDFETAYALRVAGFSVRRVHINELIAGKEELANYHLLAFPGGFSFGDDLGAGQAFAVKFLNAFVNGTKLFDELLDFIHAGNLVIGICNGFQILVKMGLLPAVQDNYGNQQSTLLPNDSARFENRWVRLLVNEHSPCVFTKGLTRLELVCRHGEGKFWPSDHSILEHMERNEQIVMRYCDERWRPTQRYPYNPNGSIRAIAGICNERGTILGMMPHPEAFIHFTNHPQWTRSLSMLRQRLPCKSLAAQSMPADGIKIFKNAYDYIKKYC